MDASAALSRMKSDESSRPFFICLQIIDI
jgi:hypothetical protein